MKKLLVLAFLSLMLHGCAATQDVNRVDHLLTWMEGDFTNEQALADKERAAVEEHLPIEVHMRRLPQFHAGLYVEQAAMSAPDRPYRQRVYLAKEIGNSIVMEVFTLADPARFRNAHKDPELLATIRLEDLTHRGGCDVILRYDGVKYVGGTEGTGCASELGDAKYATSKVEVSALEFSSLDQGWIAHGQQAWGAEKLPYLFAKTGR